MLQRQPFESVYVSDDEAKDAARLFQDMADELLVLHDPKPQVDFVPEAPSEDRDCFYDNVYIEHGLTFRLRAARMSAVLLSSCDIFEPDATQYSLSFFSRQSLTTRSGHLICTYNFNDEDGVVERTDWDSSFLPEEIPRHIGSPQRDKAIHEQVLAGQNGLRVGAAEIIGLRGTLTASKVVQR